MKLRLALVAVASTMLAGCAPGANGTLLGIVEDVVPGDRETAECEWVSTSGAGGDSYGCIYLVRAGFTKVKRTLLARLDARRFAVSCRIEGRRFKVLAKRGDVLVYADIVVGDLVLPRNVNYSDAGYEIPVGYVAVDIRADESGPAVSARLDRRCAA